MPEIDYLIQRIKQFRDARNWGRYHKPKDLAISVMIEAAELLEHFQWKTEAEVKRYVKAHKSEIADELADTMIYLLNLAELLDIDVLKAIERKLAKNERKYPAPKR